jgi:hypothetical protein
MPDNGASAVVRHRTCGIPRRISAAILVKPPIPRRDLLKLAGHFRGRRALVEMHTLYAQ